MQPVEYYEKKIIPDGELPVQSFPSNKDQASVLFEPHWHEHLEIHWVLEGTAEIHLNQIAYELNPGDVVVINSNVLHGGICRSAYKSYVIIIDVDRLSPELALKNYVYEPVLQDGSALRPLMAEYFAERSDRDIAWKQRCRALAIEILVRLCRSHLNQVLSQREADRRKRDLDRLNVVMDYIQSHYSDRIQVSQLADMLYLSEGRFCHLFREVVGSPPLQFLNELRLQKALTLLHSGSYSVTQVADMVGFRDYNHFGRLFRKRYGCTPYEVKSGKVSKITAESYEKTAEEG